MGEFEVRKLKTTLEMFDLVDEIALELEEIKGCGLVTGLEGGQVVGHIPRRLEFFVNSARESVVLGNPGKAAVGPGGHFSVREPTTIFLENFRVQENLNFGLKNMILD